MVQPKEGDEAQAQAPAGGTLVQHLTTLSARPNQFQHHAQASLRLLERRRRRGDCRAKRGAAPCEASAAAGRPKDAMFDHEPGDWYRQMSAPTQKVELALRAEAPGVHRSLSEVPQQPLKEALSEPALARSGRSGRGPFMQYIKSVPTLVDNAPGRSWPLEVTMPLLNGGTDVEDYVFVGADVPCTSGLRLLTGSFQIPHPRKAESGGEDSHFMLQDGAAMGVADGVGEWEWRFGLNPRAFADELMYGARAAAERSRGDEGVSAQDRAAAAMEEGYRATKSFGSATALVATLDALGQELGVANLGDSGLRQIRRQHRRPGSGADKEDCHGSRSVLRRTREQQHAFNCPYQLARLPGPADFDRLREEGKHALVRAVQNTPSSRQDGPGHADRYTFPVQEGDLLILGTDGVFDNLHDRELCDILGLAASPFEAPRLVDPTTGRPRAPTEPGRVAEAVAQAAFCRARDGSARTPFGVHAKEAGLYHVGGKMDDITVVAAWVVRGDAPTR